MAKLQLRTKVNNEIENLFQQSKSQKYFFLLIIRNGNALHWKLLHVEINCYLTGYVHITYCGLLNRTLGLHWHVFKFLGEGNVIWNND